MILALLMGWQFTAAEFVGGPIMIVLVAVLFRLFVRSRTIEAARAQAERDRRVDGRPRGDGMAVPSMPSFERTGADQGHHP